MEPANTTTQLEQLEATWAAFLAEWPIERLRRMTLREYVDAGQVNTFTAWIESRLDKLGSIWGGSAFKFGIYSRRDKTPREPDASSSYSDDYGWYSKYGATPEAAFAAVKTLVIQTAECAARADYAAIDSIDLGNSYKWKIAYHYQDRAHPGVVAGFKRKRLQQWLSGRGQPVPETMSELYRQTIALNPGKNLIVMSADVWKETAAEEVVEASGTLSSSSQPDAPSSLSSAEWPLNLILYRPPGTGKTYTTVRRAVAICDGVAAVDQTQLMARYRELRDSGKISFVTFHPSFSYEEFVEGIRPSTENGQVRYSVREGVFKRVATHARELYAKRDVAAAPIDLEGRTLFKMSLGDTSNEADSWIFEDCLEKDYVCLGYAAGVDFAGCDTFPAVKQRYRDARPDAPENSYDAGAAHYLKNEMRTGDLVLISNGNTRFRAIAEVVGPYRFESRPEGYDQRRAVRWLWKSESPLPIDSIFAKRLSQMTIYRMDQDAVNWNALRELLTPRSAKGQAANCVLIIDEINRANLAKTFGELLTLIEGSKRLGAADEQVTELPYSGERFSVPPNLYVIGTMNTADRSIALMDTALRRRFQFEEMAPRPELLSQDVPGIDLQKMLRVMNSRIESLFDRDHALGHSYFMSVLTFADVERRFRDQIIPLLQEYFFDDWGKIQQVFNDVDQVAELQIIQRIAEHEQSKVRGGRPRYQVNPVISPSAVSKIYA